MERFLDESKVAQLVKHLVLRSEEDELIPDELQVWAMAIEEKQTLNLTGLVRSYHATDRRRALNSLFELLDVSSISTLLLQENELEDDDMNFLIEAVTSGELKSLEHLDLSYNWGLTDRSLLNLVSCFVKGRAKGLKKLVLHHTGLGDMTVITLAEAIGSGALRSLEQLDLSHNWRLTDESMKPLAASFGNMQTTHLSELFLQHTGLGDDGVIQLAEAVASGGLRSLQKLDLSSNTGDLRSLEKELDFFYQINTGLAGITDKSMICLMTSFCTGNASSLRELHLRYTGLGGHDGGIKLAYAAKSEDSNVVRQASRLMELLSPKVERKRCSGTVIKSANTRSSERLGVLEELTLPRPHEQSMDGVIKLAEAISSGKLKYLERLDLSKCSEVTDKSMACLAASFNSGHATNLKELLLCWTRMKDDGARKLAKAIRSGKLGSLNKLDLSHVVGLSLKSMSSLAKSFGKGHTTELKELLLDKSGLGDGGVMKLAKGIALGRLKSLEKLDLSSNAGITNKSIIGLAESFGKGHATHLRELLLQKIAIEEDGVLKLAEAIDSGCLTSLEKLDLSYNTKMTDKSMVTLAAAFGTGRAIHLKELLLRWTGLSDPSVNKLREAMESGGLESLEKVDLSYIGRLTYKSIESLATCPRTGQAPNITGISELRVSGLPGQEFWIYPESCVYSPEHVLLSPQTTRAEDCGGINIRRPETWEGGIPYKQMWTGKLTGIYSVPEELSVDDQSPRFTSSYKYFPEPDLFSAATNQGIGSGIRWADRGADVPAPMEGFPVAEELRADVQDLGFTTFDQPFGGKILALYDVNSDEKQINVMFFHPQGMADLVGVGLACSQVSLSFSSPIKISIHQMSTRTWRNLWLGSDKKSLETRLPILLQGNNVQMGGAYQVPRDSYVDCENGTEGVEEGVEEDECFEWRPDWILLLLHHVCRVSSNSSNAHNSSEYTKRTTEIPFYSREERNSDSPTPSPCVSGNATNVGSGEGPQQMQSKNDFPSGTSTSSFLASTSNSSSRASLDSFSPRTANGNGRGDSSSDHPELETSSGRKEFFIEEKRLIVEIFPTNQASLHHQDSEGNSTEMEGARARTILQHAGSYVKPKVVMEFLYDGEDDRRTIDVIFIAAYQMGDQKDMATESFGWYQDDLSLSFCCEEDSAAELDPEFLEILSETALTEVELMENSEQSESNTRGTSRSLFSQIRGGMRFPFVLQNTSGGNRETTEGRTGGSRSVKQTTRTNSLMCLKEATVFTISNSSVQNHMKYRASLHTAALNHISSPRRWKEAERLDALQSGMFSGVQTKVKARWTLFGDGYKAHAFKSQKTLMRYWRSSGENAEDPCEKLLQSIGANFEVNHSFSHMAFDKWKRKKRHTWRLPRLCPVPDILGYPSDMFTLVQLDGYNQSDLSNSA